MLSWLQRWLRQLARANGSIIIAALALLIFWPQQGEAVGLLTIVSVAAGPAVAHASGCSSCAGTLAQLQSGRPASTGSAAGLLLLLLLG